MNTESTPTFCFQLEYTHPYGMVKSILSAHSAAAMETQYNLTLLDIHPEDADRLRKETKVLPLLWVTIRENQEIKVGSARLSLEEVG